MFANMNQQAQLPNPRQHVLGYAQQLGQQTATVLQQTVNTSAIRQQLMMRWSVNNFDNQDFKTWICLYGLNILDYYVSNRGYAIPAAMNEIANMLVISACAVMTVSNQNMFSSCPTNVQVDLQSKATTWGQLVNTVAQFLASMNMGVGGVSNQTGGGWGFQQPQQNNSFGGFNGPAPAANGNFGAPNANAGWGALIPQQPQQTQTQPQTQAPQPEVQKMATVSKLGYYSDQIVLPSVAANAPAFMVHNAKMVLTVDDSTNSITNIEISNEDYVDYTLHETARLFPLNNAERKQVPGDLVMQAIFDGIAHTTDDTIKKFIADMIDQNECTGDLDNFKPKFANVAINRPLYAPNTCDYHTQGRVAAMLDDRFKNVAGSLNYEKLILNYNIQNLYPWCIVNAALAKSHSQIKSWAHIRAFIEALRDHIHTEQWSQLNKDLTDLTNDILKHYLCYGYDISDFSDDIFDVLAAVSDDFGVAGVAMFEKTHLVVMNSLLKPLRTQDAFEFHQKATNTKDFLCFGKAYNITLLPALNVDVPYGVIGGSGLVSNTQTPNLQKAIDALAKNALPNNLYGRMVTLTGDTMDYAIAGPELTRLIKRTRFHHM